MHKLINWHKSSVESVQKKLGLSAYTLYLSGILEGAFYMWIIVQLSSVFKVKSDFPF